MGYTVHFWSDIPGKFSRSSEPSAEGHADEEGGVALEVNGLIELELHSTTSPTTALTSTQRTSTPMEAPDRLVSAGMI
jgi:hypothetical protein